MKMPAGVVKPGEEKYWEEAKKIVKDSYGTLKMVRVLLCVYS